jgi:redox-sensitive bicupin YhaK (pirin superfamily)
MPHPLPDPRVIERVAGFKVRRVLANAPCVGPFVLFDHYGPVDFAAGHGLDIGPHPHVGMATLTYLFEGACLTRDSMGNAMTLQPGGAIWMVAGRGAAHSERTPPSIRAAPSRLAGAQLWLALPPDAEEAAPHATHYDPAALPVTEAAGARCRVIAGDFCGARSPVGVLSPTLCVHLALEPGARVRLKAGEHPERGLYLVSGAAALSGAALQPERMILLDQDEDAALTATTAAQLMLLGGAPLGPRHLWSTALARTPARLDQAKSDWANGRIPSVVGEADRGHFPG